MEQNKVDLSKAKAGDTVVFRCGGRAVISSVSLDEPEDTTISYDFFNIPNGHRFFRNGQACFGCSLLDITEVIPAPEVFDWGTVQWGMAFEHNGSFDLPKILTYIGRGIHGSPVFQRGINPEYVSMDLRKAQDKLTRAPEHDIKEGV